MPLVVAKFMLELDCDKPTEADSLVISVGCADGEVRITELFCGGADTVLQWSVDDACEEYVTLTEFQDGTAEPAPEDGIAEEISLAIDHVA